MNNVFKFLTITIALLIFTTLHAQESGNALINVVPNTNFIAVKIRNTKELKSSYENHPLKKLIYNDRTKEIIDELLQKTKDKSKSKEKSKEQSKEFTELRKKSDEKLFAALKGEIYIVLIYDKKNDENIKFENQLIFLAVGEADTPLYQEYIKADIAAEEKSTAKKVISKKEYLNIEYFSMVAEEVVDCTFSCVVNGIAIESNNEEYFKNVLSAIVKKTSIENSLIKNEKVYSYFNSNKNKDILFSCDVAPIFKDMAEVKSDFKKKEEKNEENDDDIDPKLSKAIVEALQLEKLFLINLSFSLGGKLDTLDISLNCLDEGALQFATFTNSEFTPSPFINTEIGSYTRAFFSISELKKKIVELTNKINPAFAQEYQGVLAMLKTNLQVDVDAFFDSFGNDLEMFSIPLTNDTQDGLYLLKLKNQNTFITNLANIINNPMLKQKAEPFLTMIENKEGGNQYWSLTPKSNDPQFASLNFAIGSLESYAFISMPTTSVQRHIAQTKKDAEPKLASVSVYSSLRALFPPKVSIFHFSTTKALASSSKSFLMRYFIASFFLVDANSELYLKFLDEIKQGDFKGFFCLGLWKEKNKLSLSIKLINN